ncbi:hypothetical protein [Dongia sp.]|uniref:hypothetical protein n=1 Tax=Dongia sp. TaxID=1977262 RepID=UPI0035B17CF0
MSSVFLDPRSPSLGPHESREAQLFQLGWKSVALFGDADDISPSLEEIAMIDLTISGSCAQRTIIVPKQLGTVFSFDHRYSLFVRSGHYVDLSDLRRLLDWRSISVDSPSTHPDLSLGRLLGYSDYDCLTFTIALARQMMRHQRKQSPGPQ